MRERVLVTGGLGFIGSAFVRRFAERYDFTVLDNMSYGSNPRNLEGIPHRFVRGDINDSSLVEKVLREDRPEFVVNFAAQSHVDRSISDPTPFVRDNVAGAVSLLEAVRRVGKGVRVLHIGTDEEYGDLVEGSADESYPLRPSSPYAASKASTSLFVLSYVRTYGMEALISRSSNNYGPYQFPEKLIPKTVIRAMRGLKIPVYGSGRNRREWTYVYDNCDALELIMRKGEAGQVYNVGSGEERTNLEVVRSVLKTLGAGEDLIQFVADRPGHDMRYSMRSDRVRGLGWSPRTPFEEGLRETVRWYRNRRDWWEPLVEERPEVVSERPWDVKW